MGKRMGKLKQNYKELVKVFECNNRQTYFELEINKLVEIG